MFVLGYLGMRFTRFYAFVYSRGERVRVVTHKGAVEHYCLLQYYSGVQWNMHVGVGFS